MAIVEEYGPGEMLRRLSDPWWFQAFGCVLGFDWHSSGLTTVTCGAMKEARRIYGDDLGIHVAGGKGRTSRTTPEQIAGIADREGMSEGEQLVSISKLTAKVDSSAVQDGYQVYAHSLFFTGGGEWAVVQQGMNTDTRMARRYHWLGEHVEDFVCEPHKGLHDSSESGKTVSGLINMVAAEADRSRTACAELTGENPDRLLEELRLAAEGPTLFAPKRHILLPSDVNLSRLKSGIRKAHEGHPADFRALVGTAGVGPATVRALALLAELIHGATPCRRDLHEQPQGENAQREKRWADYAYAHGGKDGTPFPVDRDTYDQSISVLLAAVRKSRLGNTDKNKALKRLRRFL